MLEPDLQGLSGILKILQKWFTGFT